MRLDVFLCERGLARSREAAKRLISEGFVTVGGRTVTRPAYGVCEGDCVEAQTDGYVGRGAYKLKKAAEVFGLDLTGFVCGDFGASTGGFTQVMLQCGAKRVYAVDVGHGQLAAELAADDRVINMEGVNIKDVSPEVFPGGLDFAAADLSFISLGCAVPVISRVLKPGGRTVMLIKPQFECGRENVGKKGVVRSRKVHIDVISRIYGLFRENGLAVMGLDFSPIKGGDGNIEYLIAGERGGKSMTFDIAGLVERAWENLNDR